MLSTNPTVLSMWMLEKLRTLLHDSDINNLDPKKMFTCAHQTESNLTM